MKSLSLILTTLVALIPAAADAGVYGRFSATHNNIRDLKASIENDENIEATVDAGLGYSAALGYKFSMLRIEGEYYWSSNSIGNSKNEWIHAAGDIHVSSWFGNAYLDLPLFPIVHPYVGVGVGMTKVEFSDVRVSVEGIQLFNQDFTTDDSVLGYQLLAGLVVDLPITDLSLSLGYRYILMDEPDLDFDTVVQSWSEVDAPNRHVIEVGLMYAF
ncbi:MAG TPA: outer membrane beta-barrel protein [Opitutales bacterium]|nr:outer membrane beta-barrel protein [Opitutales bacterium]